MRYTLIGRDETVSFVGDPTLLAEFVAACVQDPLTVSELLSLVERHAPKAIGALRSSLAVFDEHNAHGEYEHIHTALQRQGRRHYPTFRVVDEVTRAASLEPALWGLVLFNLPQRRIIQVQNTYADVRRHGYVPTFPDERGSGSQRVYHLPVSWSIVP
ncbi:MAG: hypothetical protein M1396_07165 [Chloroflexi bacterium]|nr:hypothetical protein [Chloroflexota bacterium]